MADHYDDLDPLYRLIWGEHVHHGLWLDRRESPENAVRALVDWVADAATVGRGSRVCDVGCGYGATARQLARERDAEVVGITLSAAQCRWALEQARAGDRVEILCRDWLSNGLEPATFDAALAVESTEHFVDKAAGFHEAARVLRPGGKFVVCAWLAAERPRDWHVRHLLEPICREGRLPGMGSESEYRALLAAAGFQIDHFEELSSAVARTWTICIRRSLRAILTRSDARRYVFSRRRRGRNRVFLLTLFRLRLAYACGAMRYGLFVARLSR